MTKQNNEETMSREEVLEALYSQYSDYLENNHKEIILYGMKHEGLNNMSDEELEAEYTDHFGENIKIVEEGSKN